jgi:AraC-like DNA-binding protein
VLGEFQILMIAEGRGVLETRRGGRRHVRAGQAFVLFPDEWHRYRPIPHVGWRELWIGFGGDYATHLMRQFFDVRSPVIAPPNSAELAVLMQQLVADATGLAANPRRVATQPVIAPRAALRIRILELIALLHRSMRNTTRDGQVGVLESARVGILTHATEKIDWRAMARRYGLGYATFRRQFKQMTGRSPLDYQIQVRLNRAAEMLKSSSLTVQEVSQRLGYTHVHFFSRQFKKRFGKAPQQFREAAG